MSRQPRQSDDFQVIARTERNGFFLDLCAYIKEKRKWWIVPLAVIVTLLSILVVASQTAVAPFIYTLF